MAELQVGLGERSYPIIVEKGCLEKIGTDLAERRLATKYGVVTDSRVAQLYGDRLMEILAAAGIQAKLFIFPEGERQKTLYTVESLASRLALARFDRQDALIALGGGVAGDITGFLAASYMRGIPFVQVPTTLLAQVDSSVGGKTGVDLPEGKNLVGAFYQPKAVYIDTDVLETLKKEELLGGMAEVIKYGIIRDRDFFTFLNEYRRRILRLQPDLISEMILTCCKIKAEVVAADERESGLRKILNYGHTLGHAVEAASSYTIIHGLAVGIGMVAAAELAVMHNRLSRKDAEAVYTAISSYGIPTEVPDYIDRTAVKSYLKYDKKAVGGRIFYVLPDSIGSTYLSDEVTEDMVDAVLK